MKSVLIAYKSLPRYRIAFFESLREALAEHEVELRLTYGQPVGNDVHRQDASHLRWATHRPNRIVEVGGRHAVWQPVWADAHGSDLVIVEQANKLLINIPLLANHALRRQTPVAFWGHGANLQVHTANKVSEAFKRRLARLPHWWFAYTEGVRDRIVSLGYPEERVTVVQNATDTVALSRAVAEVKGLEAVRRSLELAPGRTGIFIGSLYPEKRLDYLLDAVAATRALLPGFKLIIAGDGPDRTAMEARVEHMPWVHYVGRVDDARKAQFVRLSDVLLMPGLVGLAVLDAFAASLPTVTTAVRYHSPEFEYLVGGDNALILAGDTDARAYGAAVAGLLSDAGLQRRLREGATRSGRRYTNEAMVSNFTQGVLHALDKGA